MASGDTTKSEREAQLSPMKDAELTHYQKPLAKAVKWMLKRERDGDLRGPGRDLAAVGRDGHVRDVSKGHVPLLPGHEEEQARDRALAA